MGNELKMQTQKMDTTNDFNKRPSQVNKTKVSNKTTINRITIGGMVPRIGEMDII